jgi:hypothetical protein
MMSFNDTVITKYTPSHTYELYMAGDINDAKRKLTQLAAEKGACWSVEPTEFVYTGGREHGFIVRTINYPRFQSTPTQLFNQMHDLAIKLMTELGQGSCSIVGPLETVWLTRRKEDKLSK